MVELAPMNNKSMDKLARSAVFAVLARGAMILGSAVGLPFVGWTLNRAVETVDKIEASTNTTASTLDLIKARLNDMREIQHDHEIRIRTIEVHNNGKK